MSKYYVRLEKRELDYKTKKRKKIIRNGAVLSIIIISIAIFRYLVYPQYLSHKKNEPLFVFNNCGYTADNFNIQLTFENEVKFIEDYYFYGESLALYDTQYTNNADPISGSLVLVDICKNREYRFRNTTQIDTNIRLGKLESGFYQLFIDLNGIRYQVATKNPVSDSMSMITRSNANNLVTFLTTTHFYEKDEVQKYNFAYIDIREEKTDDYDIVLDPGGLYATNDLGYVNGDLVESEIMYQATLYMKQKLEEYGLKIKITRDEDEIVDLKTRVSRAYDANAKIIISNRVTKNNNSSASGFHVYYPRLSSGGLASSIINTVSMQKRGSNGGLFTMTRSDNNLLDFYVMNRETGAKATQSVLDVDPNLLTNQNSNKGMNGILINHLFISNENDVDYWRQNYTSHLDEVVNAILSYLDII